LIALVTDENFRGPITRGVRRHEPLVDIVRAQDVGLLSATDDALLEWAAANDRIVATHDKRTLIGSAYQRVRAGLPMRGVLKVPRHMDNSTAIGQIILVALCSEPPDFDNQVRHLPL
jgi:hypothetical protein